MKKRLGLCLLLLTACNPRAAVDPISFAPECYNCMWTPPPCDDLAAPSCLDEVEEGTYNLCDLIDMGLKNNPTTRISWAQAKVAAANWGLSQQNYYPQLGFNAFWADIRQSGYFVGNQLFVNRYRQYSPYISLNYLILDFGTTTAQSEAIRQQLVNANWLHSRTIQSLVQTISNDYYNYIHEQQKVIASLANLEDANTVLAATEAKHLVGVTDITDELIAKTEVARETLTLINAEQSVVDIYALLIANLGLSATSQIDIQSIEEITEDPDFLCSVDNYVTLAHAARPDLHAAYAQVLSTESNLKAQKRNQLPKVSFDGTVGKDYFNNGLSKGTDYNAQISLNFPLFSGYFYQNAIKQAEAQLEQAQAEFTQTEIQMVKQVVTSYQDLRFAFDKVKVNKDYVELAEKTFQAILARYKTGTVDITTVMNSLTQLADARFSLANSKRDWFTALTDLTYATGSLNIPCQR